MYRFLPRNILRSLSNPSVPIRKFSGFFDESNSILTKTRYHSVQLQSTVRWLSLEQARVRDSIKPNYNSNVFNYGFQEKNLKKKKKMLKVKNLFRAKTKPMNIIDLTNIMMANNLANKWSKLNQEKKKQRRTRGMSQREHHADKIEAIDQKPNKNTKGIIKHLPKTKGVSLLSSDYSDIFKEKCNKSKSKNSDLTTVKSVMSVLSKAPKSRCYTVSGGKMLDLLSSDLGRNKLNSDGKLVYADLVTTPRPIFKMKFAKFWNQHPTPITVKPPPPPPPQPHKCTVTAMPKRAPIKTKSVLSSRIHPVKSARQKRHTHRTWSKNKIEEPEGGGKRYEHTKSKTKLNMVERKLKLLNSDEDRSKSSKNNFVLAFVSPEESAKSRNKES